MAPTKIIQRTVEAAVSKAKANGQALYVWDSELPGFGLRASPKGHVSWLYQYWSGGRWSKGGKARRLTFIARDLEAARIEAKRLQLQAVDGVPLETQRQKRLRLYEEQRQRQIAEAQLAKLGETLDSFIRLKRKKDHSPRYWSELEATLKRELSGKLGADRTIASITKTELQQLLDRKLADHPGAARTLYSALSPFFKWCVAREISPKPPLDGIDAPPLPQERDRILTEAELRSFWSATAQLDYLCPYFRLLLLTAQRRNEVSSIQWHELDLEKGEWLIPGEGAKNNKSHLVHLSPQALEILRAKPAFVGKGIASFGSAKKTLDKLMDVDPGNPWRIHDLRRTAASGMSELGILPHIIDKVLNHVPAKLQKIYQRNENLQERKRALEVWGAYVEALVSGRPAQGNVLQFAR